MFSKCFMVFSMLVSIALVGCGGSGGNTVTAPPTDAPAATAETKGPAKPYSVLIHPMKAKEPRMVAISLAFPSGFAYSYPAKNRWLIDRRELAVKIGARHDFVGTTCFFTKSCNCLYGDLLVFNEHEDRR